MLKHGGFLHGAWTIGPKGIALFYLPDQHPAIYALGHLDPVTQAPVIAHGLIGESQGEFYVASPLYKQQYRLRDGVHVPSAL